MLCGSLNCPRRQRANSETLRPLFQNRSCLGASSLSFAQARWSATLPDWIECHILALEFFGGASDLLVPDNGNVAIIKACHFDPQVNRTYAGMAARAFAAEGTMLPALVLWNWARTYGSILDNHLDRTAASSGAAAHEPIHHANIRGPRYYHQGGRKMSEILTHPCV